MRITTSLLLLALFAVFIGAPGVAWLAGVEGGGSALENKALEPRPALTSKAALDASWGSAFSDWVWDRLPLRDVFLRADHRIDRAVFRDSPLPLTVVFGNEGWAFTREKAVGRKAGVADLPRLLRSIENVSNAFAKAGVPFYLVISPNKGTTYPELLPPAHRAENEALVGPLVDALKLHGPPIVELWTPFALEKQRLLALPAEALAHPHLKWLFRPYDDHWSVEAGRVQAREIVNTIEPGLWRDELAPRIVGYEDAESELSKIYLKTGETEPYAKLERSPLVDVQAGSIRVANGRAINAFTSTPTASFTPKDLSIVVVRDSFLTGIPARPVASADGAMDTIAAFFRESRFVHWTLVAENTDATFEKLKGADVVVVQVAQGNVGNFTVHEKKLVRLAAIAASARD